MFFLGYWQSCLTEWECHWKSATHLSLDRLQPKTTFSINCKNISRLLINIWKWMGQFSFGNIPSKYCQNQIHCTFYIMLRCQTIHLSGFSKWKTEKSFDFLYHPNLYIICPLNDCYFFAWMCFQSSCCHPCSIWYLPPLSLSLKQSLSKEGGLNLSHRV